MRNIFDASLIRARFIDLKAMHRSASAFASHTPLHVQAPRTAFIRHGCTASQPRRRVQKRAGCSCARMALTAPVTTTSADVRTTLRRWYRSVPTSRSANIAAKKIFGENVQVEEEISFVVTLERPLTPKEEEVLTWLFAETFEPELLRDDSSMDSDYSDVSMPARITPEFGPRLSFQTAWGSNAVAVANACGVSVVRQIERFRRYRLRGEGVNDENLAMFATSVHDRMTEAVYEHPVDSLEANSTPKRTVDVDVMGRGEEALQEINESLGLGFDSQDTEYYLKLFRDDLKRNPTDVELFDLAQSNSEHSRHWYFNARLIHDDKEAPQSLMDVVRAPLREGPGNNSVLAFADNSSSIRGGKTQVLRPAEPGKPSALNATETDMDVLCTAETHNFPSGVAPFPGAETGTGGRIRDSAATGTGSLVGAGLAGYSVGNLCIPGHRRPWEPNECYPDNLASPLRILIEASNGASDYGNKFGEPVISGFARAYGLRYQQTGERREYVKPIMFSAGLGFMDHAHAEKGEASRGLAVVKIGGPAYRIGLGGGAASSMTQGSNRADLDFNAVQRGDAQMEQKAYRVIRACVELGAKNPIVSIHDQGAGGNCNVVKELIFPEGATIRLRDIWIGDRTLSALEIWGAEYQEQFGLLLRPEDTGLFEEICRREGVVATEIGRIDGSGRVVLWDSAQDRSVADMDLQKVLGKLPRKTFVDKREQITHYALATPLGDSLRTVLGRVLTLMGVGSKRFLTTKVDRSVTGLVALQQTVGALQLPVADAGMLATSYFGPSGAVTAIGERPTLTTLSPAAMARISVAEMLTNIACVKLTSRKDIKCEANWMWAAKLPGDGAAMYDAAVAMSDSMIRLGIAVDGGKDSLSMAAQCPTEHGASETVRAPGTLVITGYCTVPDVNAKLTPDIKRPGGSKLLHIDLGGGKYRMGGSAIAQVYGQVGDVPPDVDDVDLLARTFDVLQTLHDDDNVLAYHDISDGGLLVAVLEMAFAGNCGVELRINASAVDEPQFAVLFAEEVGVVLEVADSGVDEVVRVVSATGAQCKVLGSTTQSPEIVVRDGPNTPLRESMVALRDIWEITSFAIEKLQADPDCVTEEQTGLKSRSGLSYVVPYTPRSTSPSIMNAAQKARVAILRAEGSNGDREMAAAFHMAGFETWDVSMADLRNRTVSLDGFRGLAMVGGFSYADVLDSAKGWAGVARYCEPVRDELQGFFARKDTFSLGVCNGCQLMALLGVVPGEHLGVKQPRFIHNRSQRYESRFVAVTVKNSPAMMLKGMEGARLGVWVAHGEGRAHFPDKSVQDTVLDSQLAPLRYVDDSGDVTVSYPFNPNGSPHGIAALCSPDGRHLAMMPHPERAVLPWQWAYPQKTKTSVSPWLKMFQNALEWCVSVSV